MAVLKLFKNGTSQAVRIPKEMEFPGKRVRVRRYNGGLLILPDESAWTDVYERLDELGACAIEAPEDLPPEEIG